MDIREEAKQFEEEAGVSLPEALVMLYENKGNGGFGPEYGMLGIITGHKTDLGDSILSLYKTFCESDPEDPGWYWPRNLVPFIHVGCAIHYCVDLNNNNYPVIEFDPNGYGPGEELSNHFKQKQQSFNDWVNENCIKA